MNRKPTTPELPRAFAFKKMVRRTQPHHPLSPPLLAAPVIVVPLDRDPRAPRLALRPEEVRLPFPHRYGRKESAEPDFVNALL